MALTKPFDRMLANSYAAPGDIPAGLTVGTFIKVAGVDKEVVSSGEDETVGGNKLRNVAPGRQTVREKSANYTVVIADDGALIRCTAALTLALPAVSTLTNGWFVDVLASTGTTTIDPDGAETINGAASLAITVGKSCRIRFNGSTFYSQFLSEDVGLIDVVDDTTPQLGGPLDGNSHQFQASYGASIAAATELLVLTDGNTFVVTGAADIASIEDTADVIPVGTEIELHFDIHPSDYTYDILYDASALITPTSANIALYDGDIVRLIKHASGSWTITNISRKNGLSLVRSAPFSNVAINSATSAASSFTTKGPYFVTVVLTCLTGEHGYSAGQAIQVPVGTIATAGNKGVDVTVSGSSVAYRTGSATKVFSALNGSGVIQELTNANWDMTIYLHQML